MARTPVDWGQVTTVRPKRRPRPEASCSWINAGLPMASGPTSSTLCPSRSRCSISRSSLSRPNKIGRSGWDCKPGPSGEGSFISVFPLSATAGGRSQPASGYSGAGSALRQSAFREGARESPTERDAPPGGAGYETKTPYPGRTIRVGVISKQSREETAAVFGEPHRHSPSLSTGTPLSTSGRPVQPLSAEVRLTLGGGWRTIPVEAMGFALKCRRGNPVADDPY
jgi:hypothetical protein